MFPCHYEILECNLNSWLFYKILLNNTKKRNSMSKKVEWSYMAIYIVISTMKVFIHFYFYRGIIQLQKIRQYFKLIDFYCTIFGS